MVGAGSRRAWSVGSTVPDCRKDLKSLKLAVQGGEPNENRPVAAGL